MQTANQHRRQLKKELRKKTINKTLYIKDSGINGTGKIKEIGVQMEIWDDPPEVLIPKKEDEGKRVWIAGKTSTFDSILQNYHEPGEDEFPEGGVTVIIKDPKAERGLNSVRNLFYDEVVLHPEEITSKRLRDYDYTVGDKRKS